MMTVKCWSCRKPTDKSRIYIDGKGHRFCSLYCSGNFKREKRESAIVRSQIEWDKRLKGLIK